MIPELLAVIDQADRGPAPGDLDGAPVLSNWFIDEQRNGVLTALGDLRGHPTIDDPSVRTSPVIGFNIDQCWMRTLSRWYRLERPMPLADPDALAAFQGRLTAERNQWREQDSYPHMGYVNTPPPVEMIFSMPRKIVTPASVSSDDNAVEYEGW